MQNLSIYIAADSVVDYLGEYIKRNSKSQIECEIGPYNQVSQILLTKAKKKSIFIWTSPDIQIPSFGKLISSHGSTFNDRKNFKHTTTTSVNERF